MTVGHAPSAHQGALRVSEWVIGLVGLFGAFLGLFILFAEDEQYVGFGGESSSWRVGDIAPGWGYGLLAGGIFLLLTAGALVQRDRHRGPGMAVSPRSSRADLLVHATAFLLVNAFVWIQDIAIGDGLNYAYWVTIPWGVGLAVHAAAVLAQERRHETSTR